MEIIIDEDCKRDLMTPKLIEDGIKKFLLFNFPDKYLKLNVIEFLPSHSPRFGPQVEGIALSNESRILLKYESFERFYKEGGSVELETEIFNVLSHEMQHIINHEELKELIDSIEKLETFSYVKVGIEKIIDEYRASYHAHRIVPGANSGVLNLMPNIVKDVKNKKAEPLTLYLNIINFIAWFIGETQAVYEFNGTDKWEEVCKKTDDKEFYDILEHFRNAIEFSNLGNMKLYIKTCEDALIDLLKYVRADFNFLITFDEFIKTGKIPD